MPNEWYQCNLYHTKITNNCEILMKKVAFFMSISQLLVKKKHYLYTLITEGHVIVEIPHHIKDIKQ